MVADANVVDARVADRWPASTSADRSGLENCPTGAKIPTSLVQSILGSYTNRSSAVLGADSVQQLMHDLVLEPVADLSAGPG